MKKNRLICLCILIVGALGCEPVEKNVTSYNENKPIRQKIKIEIHNNKLGTDNEDIIIPAGLLRFKMNNGCVSRYVCKKFNQDIFKDVYFDFTASDGGRKGNAIFLETTFEASFGYLTIKNKNNTLVDFKIVVGNSSNNSIEQIIPYRENIIFSQMITIRGSNIATNEKVTVKLRLNFEYSRSKNQKNPMGGLLSLQPKPDSCYIEVCQIK